MNIIIGLIIIAIGAFCQSSCYVPINKVKQWSWESYWLVEIDVLMADREEFLRSTKIVFEESHPKFIAYLQDKGLTDWEIGYCCLYTLGLKGKDICEFIQKKRHYIISHEIRQKLGLDEHDTNISIYLRDLLLDLEL